MTLNRATKETVNHWLERVSKDRYGEAEELYQQADTYWSDLDHEITLRVYQQFDFGGYHGKLLDELWERQRQFPTSDQCDDPIDWFLSWIITPEQDGLYLDGSSYLIDLEPGAVLDDAHEDGERITNAFVERGFCPAGDDNAKQLVSSYFSVLVKVLQRFLRVFVMQNADLMTNAPRFKRLFFMEREATLIILEYLKEGMKRQAESEGNASGSSGCP